MLGKPSMISNQPKEKPLIDVEGKIRNIANSQQSGSVGIQSGSEGMKWRWCDSVMDEATLSKHERLMGDTRKASFIFGKVTP